MWTMVGRLQKEFWKAENKVEAVSHTSEINLAFSSVSFLAVELDAVTV